MILTKHMLRLLALSGLLMLAGCPMPTPTHKIEATCASATSSIQIATLYKDKLTEAQVERVKQAISIVEPVCGDRDTVPTLDSVKLAAFETAVNELFKIATEAQK